MRSAKYSGPTFVETPFAVVATKSLWGPVSTSFAHLESEVFLPILLCKADQAQSDRFSNGFRSGLWLGHSDTRIGLRFAVGRQLLWDFNTDPSGVLLGFMMLFAAYYSLNKSSRLLQNSCLCNLISVQTAELYLIVRSTFNPSATSNFWKQMAGPVRTVAMTTADAKWKENSISHKDNSWQSKMLTWWVCIGLVWPQNP